MRIVSKFTTNMISKFAKVVLRKKLGYNIDIQLNEIKAAINERKTHVHLDIDVELDGDELLNILKNSGLG